MTGKQQKFIEFYLGVSNGNATDAARRAGYSGTSESLRVTGHDLLTNTNVSEEIQRRLKEQAMGADEVLARLAAQAQGVGEYVRYHRNALGKFETYLDLEALLADGKGHLIKCIKKTDKGEETIELYDAQTALLNLGRYHKLFTDKTEGSLSVNHTFEDELDALPDEEFAERAQAVARALSPERLSQTS